MAQSDLEVLLDMGFEQARAELAIKKPGGCEHHLIATVRPTSNKVTVQGALEWLEKTQDKSLEDLQNEAKEDELEAASPSIESLEGQVAKSLVCNECGKKFRNHAAAEFHASKTYVTASTSSRLTNSS